MSLFYGIVLHQAALGIACCCKSGPEQMRSVNAAVMGTGDKIGANEAHYRTLYYFSINVCGSK